MTDLLKIGDKIINLRHVYVINLIADDPGNVAVRFVFIDKSSMYVTGPDAVKLYEWVDFNVQEGGIWDIANDVND